MVAAPIKAMADLCVDQAAYEAATLVELAFVAQDHNVSLLDPFATFKLIAELHPSKTGLPPAFIAYRRYVRSRGYPEPLTMVALFSEYKLAIARAKGPQSDLRSLDPIHELFAASYLSDVACRDAVCIVLKAYRLTDRDIVNLNPGCFRFTEAGGVVAAPISHRHLSLRRLADEHSCSVHLLERWQRKVSAEGPYLPAHWRGRHLSESVLEVSIRSILQRGFKRIGFQGGLTKLRHALVVQAFDTGASEAQILEQFNYRDVKYLREIYERYRGRRNP
jgi:hypothetical protein